MDIEVSGSPSGYRNDMCSRASHGNNKNTNGFGTHYQC